MAGCNTTSSGKMKIATTFAPIYDYAKRIVGDKADLYCVVGDNEPHDFSPNDPAASIFCAEAKVLFSYGHEMDTWADRLSKNTFNVTNGVGFDENNGVIDPHAWLSLKESQTMMKNIKDKMVEIDPDNSTYYSENYDKAVSEFSNAMSDFSSRLEGDKLSSKVIVTSHEAFGYFAKEYGLTQYGIGDIAAHEPDSGRITSTIEYIKENSVKYIFVEELDEVGHVETIVNELKKENYIVEYKTLSAYEGVNVDEYDKEGDYLSVMKENVLELETCLKE